MAQLQYIGARYVPIWYHNSVDDTANWEPNVEYEPLTWVTTPNNHLYLSKKTVPDNIGTPAQNTEYWLDMGVMTGGGSYEHLQEEIDNITDNIIPPIVEDVSALGTAVNNIANVVIPALADRVTAIEDEIDLWEDVFCVIRQEQNGSWSILNDSGHEPKHVTSVGTDNNGMLVINFDKTYAKVGTGIMMPDETYTTQNIMAGVSVGNSAARAYFRQGSLGGTFNFSGTTPTIHDTLSGDINSVAWSSSQAGFEVTLAGYSGGSMITGVSVIVGSSGTAGAAANLNFKVRIVSGNVFQLIPNQSISNIAGYLQVIVQKDRVITAQNMIPYTSANWWYYGKMKKAAE